MKFVIPFILLSIIAIAIFFLIPADPGESGDVTRLEESETIESSSPSSSPSSSQFEVPAALPVLLAFEETRFKSALIERMKEVLEGRGVAVQVRQHSAQGFDSGDLAGYRAVFVSNSGVNSAVRPWIVSWLNAQTAPQHRDKIILHTTQNRDWSVETSVDSVTSASATGDVEKLAVEYVERLLAIGGQAEE